MNLASEITKAETKVAEWERRFRYAERDVERNHARERVRHFKSKCYRLATVGGFSISRLELLSAVRPIGNRLGAAPRASWGA